MEAAPATQILPQWLGGGDKWCNLIKFDDIMLPSLLDTLDKDTQDKIRYARHVR